MTMITPSYLGETIEYSSLHACRSTLEDPTEIIAQWLRPKKQLARTSRLLEKTTSEERAMAGIVLINSLDGQ